MGLIELFLIVVAIIGLLAAIGVPSFIGARKGAEDNMKKVNIAAVNAAKEQWSIVNNIPDTTPLPQSGFTNIAPYLGNSITNLAGLNVGTGAGSTIQLNNIGTSASY